MIIEQNEVSSKSKTSEIVWSISEVGMTIPDLGCHAERSEAALPGRHQPQVAEEILHSLRSFRMTRV
jgi:hypothetical protein